jgi:hypothetical protein
MGQLSVIIPKELDHKLKLKAKEMNLKKSDTIRLLLHSALENDVPSSASKANSKELQCLVTTYHLLNEYLLSLGDKGIKMNNLAHEKANKVIAALIKK